MQNGSVTQTRQRTRFVSDYGETLIVREVKGRKVLVDTHDEGVIVFVPIGRRAKLICYSFSGISASCGQEDHHVCVFQSDCGIGFASVRHPQLRIVLQELTSGQKVDVLPATDHAAAYAIVVRPLPVLYGAATAQIENAALVAA